MSLIQGISNINNSWSLPALSNASVSHVPVSQPNGYELAHSSVIDTAVQIPQKETEAVDRSNSIDAGSAAHVLLSLSSSHDQDLGNSTTEIDSDKEEAAVQSKKRKLWTQEETD